MELIDTNVILRYLVGDNKELFDKAEKMFKEARSGKRKILIKVVVVAESCYVLESFYKKTKEEIATGMEVLLSQKWLKVEDRQALLGMWPWYKDDLHFVDSYLIACSKFNKYKITTFDKVLEKESSLA